MFYEFKFNVGDWVKRRVNVFDSSSPYRLGRVVRRYSKKEITLPVSGSTLGPYPELYEVEWEDGKIESSFLPHGIDAAELHCVRSVDGWCSTCKAFVPDSHDVSNLTKRC